MEWSLLPDALRPFKIFCTSPSITSQLVLYFKAEETPKSLSWETVLWRLYDRLNASNGILYSQVKSVGSYSTSGRKKEGWKGKYNFFNELSSMAN
jgi:hypothetical protein